MKVKHRSGFFWRQGIYVPPFIIIIIIQDLYSAMKSEDTEVLKDTEASGTMHQCQIIT